MYKQIFTIVALAVLLGLGARVVQNNPVPFWGFPKPIELIQPKGVIAENLIVSADEAFAPASKPYGIDYSTTMGLYSKAKRDSIHFVDARDPELYAAGHIPGAVSIPFEFLGENQSKLDVIPKDKLLVIYCEGGDCTQSHELAEHALSLGWNRICIFNGGWDVWVKESDFVATGKDAR